MKIPGLRWLSDRLHRKNSAVEAYKSPVPRVAVIAVHGVGYHKPKETAHAAADLLAGTESGNAHYQTFRESELLIDVRPVRVPEASKPSRHWYTFAQRSDSIKKRHKEGPGDSDDLDHQYMLDQLREYKVQGDDRTYETVRLDSIRTEKQKITCEVHLYEMYWADLSRFASGAFSFIVEFYQLLFYLPELGKKTLDAACAKYHRSRLWKWFSQCNDTAERLLTLWVPIWNLYVLAITLLVVPLLLSVTNSYITVAIIAAALAAAIVGSFLYGIRKHIRANLWPVCFVFVALVGTLCGLVTEKVSEQLLGFMLAILWAAVALSIVLFLMWIYHKRRPGAFPAAVLALIVVLPVYIYETWQTTSVPLNHQPQALFDAALRTAEWLLIPLFISWDLLWLAALLSTIFSGCIWFRREYKRDNAAHRAAWTAHLSIVLPAVLVLIVTVMLWKTLLKTVAPFDSGDPAFVTCDAVMSSSPNTASAGFFEKSKKLWQSCHQPLKIFVRYRIFSKDQVTAFQAANTLLQVSATGAFAVFCGVVVLGAILSVWFLFPAIILEERPPPVDNALSEWLGKNLSAAFCSMRVPGEMIRWLFLLGFPFGSILLLWHSDLLGKWPDWALASGAIRSIILRVNDLLADLLGSNDWALAAGAAVVLGLLTARKFWAPRVGLALDKVLGIALDVANWLRLHPGEQNPRSRICARYVSLLRHICTWRPVDGHGYDGIVILAHSQGTVITADLLRFLLRENEDPELKSLKDGIPIYFFTMGCPLRQLYGLRIPHLYDWARHSNTKPCKDGNPVPSELLAVKRWVNAYRSGDYVGRYLWHRDNCNLAWSTSKVFPDQDHPDRTDRQEFCIGAGAHLNYWDKTAPRIAAELDELIRVASQKNMRND